MLTWRLHHALNHPPKHHPVIWRHYRRLLLPAETRARKPLSLPRHRLNPLFNIVGLVLLAPAVNVLLIALFFPSPLLALIANNGYGAVIAYTVSRRISCEHERDTYPVLGTLPLGKLGIHWIFLVSHLEDMHRWGLPLRILLALGLFATPFLFGALAFPLTRGRAVEFWLVDSVSFIIVLVYDYFSTRVIAALLAMLVPALDQRGANVPLTAAALFLLLQVGWYLLAAVIVLSLLPAFLALMNADRAWLFVVEPVAVVGVILVREGLIRLLLAALKRALNTNPAELDLITR